MPSLHHTQTPSDPHDQVSDSNHSPISDTQIPSDLPDDDPSKKAGKWTPLEDDLLRKYVPVFGEKQWRKISEHIPGRTSIQCLHRWTKILKPGLVKGPWTAEEDQKLLSWVKAEGPAKWAQCANLIKGRSGKQCRERWSNNLNPNVKKGNWAKEEDELIFELYQKFGSSWSKIAKYIPGRTENAIKNRFYSTLRKLTADKKKDQPEKHEDLCLGEEEVQNEDSPAKNILDMGVPVQTPSALYQLLNTKTSAISPNEEMKEETCSDEKKLQQQQAFNINGEKVVVLRDIKPSEKKIKKAANKLVSDEVQENDAAFEVFLNSIQVDINYNFVKTGKLNLSVKDNDTTHFDGLQNKIKGYCQTNIKDLAEGFKPLDTNKTSSTASEISTSDMKARSLLFPQRSASSVLPISNNQQECSNIRGTTIITPTPNKQAELFAKAPQMLSRAASSPLTPVFSPFSPFNNSSMFQPKLFNDNKMNVEQNWSLPLNKGFSQGFLLNNMTAMMQNSLSMSMPGSDQKMAMLFQQMYSLEVMLAKTRNELMNFEKHLKENEGKNFGGENMKVEDDHHIFVKPNMLGCRPFGNFTSEFEEVLKKRKVE